MVKSAAKMAPAPVKVLWMDDEPDAIENYKRLIEHERGPNFLSIDVVDSIPKTRERLRSGKYAALVVDFNMEQSRVATPVNGAKFLKDINEQHKWFPTFVYSSFLGEERYLRFLKESHPIEVVSKSQTTFERPVSSHPFFHRVYEAGRDYLDANAYRPEMISYEDYIKAPEQFAPEVEMYSKKHKHWIRAKMKEKNWVWAIVCGGNLVDGSSDIADFPSDEQLEEYGRQTHLIPFPFFTKAFLPEETQLPASTGVPWVLYDDEKDYYPTFKANVDELEILDDFDTGAPKTWVSDQVIKRKAVNVFMSFDGLHLGQPFSGTFKKIRVKLTDSTGASMTKEMVVGVVKDWSASSFVELNPNRRVLFGRDLLREFPVEVTLDSKRRITRITFL